VKSIQQSQHNSRCSDHDFCTYSADENYTKKTENSFVETKQSITSSEKLADAKLADAHRKQGLQI